MGIIQVCRDRKSVSGGSEPPQSDMTCVIETVVLATQLSPITSKTWRSPVGEFLFEKHSLLIEQPPTTFCDPEMSFSQNNTFSEHTTVGIAASGKAGLATGICSTHSAANTSLPIAR